MTICRYIHHSNLISAGMYQNFLEEAINDSENEIYQPVYTF